MIFGSRALTAALVTLCGVLLAGPVLAQTKTITTTGTSSGTGEVHITIEDFSKPGHYDLGPQALTTVIVLIQEGWDCAQTTQAIFAALVEALPDGYVLSVFTRDPCTIIISCKTDAPCDGWDFTEFTETVPGQTIVTGEPGVPVKNTTWGGVKARYFSP